MSNEAFDDHANEVTRQAWMTSDYAGIPLPESGVSVRADDILFVAGSLRGLVDFLVKPDVGKRKHAEAMAAAAMAAANIESILASYVDQAERKVRDSYARRDVGVSQVST